MNITELPLSESFRITVFFGSRDYSLSKTDGTVLFNNGKYIETEFSNKRGKYPNHKIWKYTSITNENICDFYLEAGLEIPAEPTKEFKTFLRENGIDGNSETMHIIFPKTTKKLVGKKHLIEFNVGSLDFGYGEGVKQELEVFITPITKTSKSITFSMLIPTFLYNKCMLNPIIEERPNKRYIISYTLSGLHDTIQGLVAKAHNLWKLDKDAENAKKVLIINFSSTEKSKRDDYNHGYTGQEIKTTFNFFIAYSTTKGQLFTFSKLQSGMGTTEKGIKGILDSELSGKRNWIQYTKADVIIDWTKEREEFLTKLENQFRILSSNLNEFLKDLNEDKLQHLIDNQNTIKLITNN
jgi:hypothetical protein